jgi:2-polyprenyl-6-methoxyphenol hydroxylase-like FAD-dependent oxidoreductase
MNMAGPKYDAIVVGARCAGSPTAMLLARKGHRVLLVDRAQFPSDTVSTHLIHPPGVAALRRWGLLDAVAASNAPAIHTYRVDVGPFAIAGTPGTPDEPWSYGPRRIVLDKILLDAAAAAGAEVREEFMVEELTLDDGRVTGIKGHGKGGRTVTETAQVVIGADGIYSHVAKQAGAESYLDRAPLEASYYSYWSHLPMEGRFEAYDRGDRSWAVWPTNDGLTLVIVGWPIAQFDANKYDFEGHYLRAFDRAPEFAARIRDAKCEERLVGASVPNFFRKPWGPGWALVGDAGYTRDFMTAQGINDAFRDSELCANALDDAWSGRRSYDEAMGDYQSRRDRQVRAMYEFTCDFASFTPPTPEKQQLMGAIHGNPEAMDGFARVIAGVTSPAEFFSEENVGRIFAGAAARA